MKTKALVLIILLFGLTCLFNAAISSASDWNKASTITFKNPVQIPGQILPAGMYVFKLLDDDMNHHVVQIWNAEQTKLVATVLATTTMLLDKSPTESSVMFEEQVKGKPMALKVWFHPGSPYGEQFTYPAKKN
jgi:hypothetical protein